MRSGWLRYIVRYILTGFRKVFYIVCMKGSRVQNPLKPPECLEKQTVAWLARQFSPAMQANVPRLQVNYRHQP